MKGHIYTIEEIKPDAVCVSYCLNSDGEYFSYSQSVVNDNPKQTFFIDEPIKFDLSFHGGLTFLKRDRTS